MELGSFKSLEPGTWRIRRRYAYYTITPLGSEDVLVTGLTHMDEQNVLVGSSLQHPQYISINFHGWAYH
jgi:hypothetical protein